MKKAEKSFFVQNLTEELKSASSVVLVDYSGLSVKMQQELKKRLRETGANMKVVKNTLFKRAGLEAKSPKEVLTDSVLSGPTATVITEEDPIAPLSILAKFAKEFNILELKVGIVEGSFQDKDSLSALSKLPSKKALYAQVVGSISSPLNELVYGLQANMQKLTLLLSEYLNKKSEEQK
jgi:large subunit ribosomal protein L10